MAYLVIETHGGAECAAIVTDEDGNNKVFNDFNNAMEEANDCQDGVVVEI
jgi:hypothetical protein